MEGLWFFPQTRSNNNSIDSPSPIRKYPTISSSVSPKNYSTPPRASSDGTMPSPFPLSPVRVPDVFLAVLCEEEEKHRCKIEGEEDSIRFVRCSNFVKVNQGTVTSWKILALEEEEHNHHRPVIHREELCARETIVRNCFVGLQPLGFKHRFLHAISAIMVLLIDEESARQNMKNHEHAARSGLVLDVNSPLVLQLNTLMQKERMARVLLLREEREDINFLCLREAQLGDLISVETDERCKLLELEVTHRFAISTEFGLHAVASSESGRRGEIHDSEDHAFWSLCTEILVNMKTAERHEALASSVAASMNNVEQQNVLRSKFRKNWDFGALTQEEEAPRVDDGEPILSPITLKFQSAQKAIEETESLFRKREADNEQRLFAGLITSAGLLYLVMMEQQKRKILWEIYLSTFSLRHTLYLRDLSVKHFLETEATNRLLIIANEEVLKAHVILSQSLLLHEITDRKRIVDDCLNHSRDIEASWNATIVERKSCLPFDTLSFLTSLDSSSIVLRYCLNVSSQENDAQITFASHRSLTTPANKDAEVHRLSNYKPVSPPQVPEEKPLLNNPLVNH
eukprot:PhF_6_TR20853/c0_g1_i2/m.30055